MAVSPPGTSKNQLDSSFEIKSAQLSLVSLILKQGNLSKVTNEFLEKFGPQGESPDFFDNDLLILDFSQISEDSLSGTLIELLNALHVCKLKAVAIRSSSAELLSQARALGLVDAPADLPRKTPNDKASALTASSTASVSAQKAREVVREVIREVPGASTMVVDKPLRSGQKVYARGGDLVVMAMVNPGAEVVADGNIHVYAPLRGKAMAGATGNPNARIFSLCLEAELISIAGIYRTSENPLPPAVFGKAAQVRLSDDGQEKLLIEALKT